MIDFGVAYDKLAGFETADEIAGYLKHEGIKAFPGDASSCAIAMWAQETVGDSSIRVSQYEMWEGHYYGEGESFAHTDAMKEFTLNFDNGRYPELVVEGWYGGLR